MCIIALSYQQHPDYPLLLAANRDEFFAMTAELLSTVEPGAVARVISGDEEARLSAELASTRAKAARLGT